MKKTTKLWAILIAAILLLAAFACSKPADKPAEPTQAPVAEQPTAEPVVEQPTAEPVVEQPTEEPAPDTSVTLVDMMGHEVTLEKPAERIVALTASDCEIVYALGAGDLLVGRGEYCDYPAEVFNVPSVESGGNTNIEQILALNPDVVVMSSMAQTEEQVKQLEDAGVAVVVNDAKDIAGVYTSIEILGKLLGRDAEAQKIIEDMQAGFAEIEANKLDGTQTVYFEVSPLQWGLWTAGKGTFMNEIAEMMGLKNCFEDLDDWAQISEEQVLERNPDYIVTITMYWGEGPTPEEEIMSRPGWENVTAVKNGAILNLPNNELSRPIPRLADGAKMLYDFVEQYAEALAPAA
ncbi:MAG: ABC transporter substrate-binding protein [Clostridia bacterium]|jgi:iron complex transport system substrate-binding protein|nr:ABC transporter substrate-binding protein [Clostridia bacterium]MBR2645424.1 ABC transporter substrate-binding protein [Clostridia bacterium]MBR3038504.1 ABC transporter substrate-binding protein [Clostridia bacterium]